MSDGDAGGRTRRRPRLGWTGARFPRTAPEDGGDPEAVVEIAEPRSPDDPVGHTGARFNSRGRRARREAGRLATPETVPPPELPDPRAGRDAVADSAADDAVANPAGRDAVANPDADDAPTMPIFIGAFPPPESTRTTVRPYVRTRGRTRTRIELRVETMVSIPSPRPALDDPEHRAIGELCDDPRSVAEVAALLSVPLGVARVLIDDMAGEGKLTVHPTLAPEPSAPGPPQIALMRRVLDGLHRL